MADYLLLPPNKNVLAGRTVTSTTGTPDADHPVAWLTDVRPAFPIRYPSGAWGVSVSVATEDIQLVVLANHCIDATVTVGGAAGTITAVAAMENGIRKNTFLYLNTPTPDVTALTLAGTNTDKMILGECLAGVPVSLKPAKMEQVSDEFQDASSQLSGEWMNIPEHDDAEEFRIIEGTNLYTDAERASFESLWRAQRGHSLPAALIMDSAVQDARIVQMQSLKCENIGRKDLWRITFTFLEYPRYRW